MKRGERKNWPKLIRPPYEFDKVGERMQKEDLSSYVRDCECKEDSTPAPADPSHDPGQCLLDHYQMCGNRCLVELQGWISIYLRRAPDGPDNPQFIFVQNVCSDGEQSQGACFQFVESVDCEGVVGRIVGDDEWQPLPGQVDDDNPPCNNPVYCASSVNCQWIVFNLCPDDDAADLPGFSPKTIYVQSGFVFGVNGAVLIAGQKTYQYNGHCYTSQSPNPCVSEVPPGGTVPGFDELTSRDGCDDDHCVCCDGAGDALNDLISGLKQRIKFVNGGSLPTVVGHDFTDVAYALNLDANILPGTLCVDHATLWRQQFVEIDWWLGTSDYLYNASVSTRQWIDTNLYPDGDISEVATSPVAVFDSADYEAQVQASPVIDWFRTAFSTNATTGEQYTQGGTCGYSEPASVLRFGDLSAHVVVNDPSNDVNFCNMVNCTIDRLLIAVQKLVGVQLGADFADKGRHRLFADAGLLFLQSAACVVQNAANTPASWCQTGTSITSTNLDTSCVGTIADCDTPGSPNNIHSIVGINGANGAVAQCQRGLITADASTLEGGHDIYFYLKVRANAVVSGGDADAQANSVKSNFLPLPTDDQDWDNATTADASCVWRRYSHINGRTGVNFTANQYVLGSQVFHDPAVVANTQMLNVGWYIVDQIGIAIGNFTI